MLRPRAPREGGRHGTSQRRQTFTPDLAERAIMLDKPHAGLERASTRAGFIAGVQVALLKLEWCLLLSDHEYWHGLSLRAGVQLGAGYGTHIWRA